MNETDLDQPLLVFEVDGRQVAESWIDSFDRTRLGPAADQGPAQLGDALIYLGYQRLDDSRDQLLIATLWRVIRPLSQAVMFSHVLGDDGRPLAQADRLDAPGDFWVPGDIFIQLHQIDLPDALPAGVYPLAIGLYTTDSMDRLPVIVDSRPTADQLLLPEVTIAP